MDAALAHVYDPRYRPLSEIKWIALGISQPKAEEDQRHIGLLYRDEDAEGGITMLDLAWHHRLRSNPPQPGHLWVEPAVPPELAPAFQQLCKVVANKYGGRKPRSIAYALRYETGSFDPASGEFLNATGHGLTCATFVLAMFASYGVHLVCVEEWLACKNEVRAAEDHVWQKKIVKSLRCTLESKRRRSDAREIEAHLAAVEGEIGCARFRPEEVAAAGTVAKLPAGFAHAEPVGREIVEKLRQRFP